MLVSMSIPAALVLDVSATAMVDFHPTRLGGGDWHLRSESFVGEHSWRLLLRFATESPRSG